MIKEETNDLNIYEHNNDNKQNQTRTIERKQYTGYLPEKVFDNYITYIQITEQQPDKKHEFPTKYGPKVVMIYTPETSIQEFIDAMYEIEEIKEQIQIENDESKTKYRANEEAMKTIT